MMPVAMSPTIDATSGRSERRRVAIPCPPCIRAEPGTTAPIWLSNWPRRCVSSTGAPAFRRSRRTALTPVSSSSSTVSNDSQSKRAPRAPVVQTTSIVRASAFQLVGATAALRFCMWAMTRCSLAGEGMLLIPFISKNWLLRGITLSRPNADMCGQPLPFRGHHAAAAPVWLGAILVES